MNPHISAWLVFEMANQLLQMRLNYLGSLHAAKAVYNSMVTRNTGHIVFVSSTMALMGFTG